MEKEPKEEPKKEPKEEKIFKTSATKLESKRKYVMNNKEKVKECFRLYTNKITKRF